ncbi:unnamed protein product [Musa acuminata subsp. burmannicoides]
MPLHLLPRNDIRICRHQPSDLLCGRARPTGVDDVRAGRTTLPEINTPVAGEKRNIQATIRRCLSILPRAIYGVQAHHNELGRPTIVPVAVAADATTFAGTLLRSHSNITPLILALLGGGEERR